METIMSKRTIETTWELRSYDVWGNAKDGYEVNDSHAFEREHALTLTIEVNNPGSEMQFESAFPSMRQIRAAFGVKRMALDIDGDDTTIYVNRSRDAYPIGEMYCTSHESLSPIRPNKAN